MWYAEFCSISKFLEAYIKIEKIISWLQLYCFSYEKPAGSDESSKFEPSKLCLWALIYWRPTKKGWGNFTTDCWASSRFFSNSNYINEINDKYIKTHIQSSAPLGNAPIGNKSSVFGKLSLLLSGTNQKFPRFSSPASRDWDWISAGQPGPGLISAGLSREACVPGL